MPGATLETRAIGSPVWMADYASRDHLMIGPIELNADAFPDNDSVAVQVGTAGAAAGATSIPVEALSGAIPSGTMLNFGSYAPVTVTVNDADVNAAETSITVEALSGPIPAGTRLEFSGAGAGYAQLTADADTGDTTLTVEALPEDIDNAATATFAGGTKQARLTAAAAAGATSLTVDELQFALVDDEIAYYDTNVAKKRIAAGTLVGRTFTERETNVPFEPWAESDDEVFLIAFDVVDAEEDNSATAVRPGAVIKENFLPGYATYSAAKKAAIRAAYQTQKGAA